MHLAFKSRPLTKTSTRRDREKGIRKEGGMTAGSKSRTRESVCVCGGGTQISRAFELMGHTILPPAKMPHTKRKVPDLNSHFWYMRVVCLKSHAA